MIRYVIRRLGYMVVILLLTSVFVFALSRARGDPRQLFLGDDDYVTKETYEAWGREMGLDKPLVVQYLVWASKAIRGDFGDSLVEKNDVRAIILKRFPATALLSGAAFGLVIVLGVPLGMLSAVKRGSVWDLAGRMFALFGQALPVFWVGIMFILIFSVTLRWLPTSQMGGLDNLVLPSIALGWHATAATLRLVRSSMLEVLDSEYVMFARSKGVPSVLVVWKHALRNALIPPLTHFGLLFAAFITGTVVVETVFAWPGIGRLAISSVFDNDFPVLAALVMMFAVIYVLMNLLVDVLYGVIDPRIRYS